MTGFAILIIIFLSLIESFAKTVAKPPTRAEELHGKQIERLTIQMKRGNNPFAINVGFLVKAEAGFQREFEFDLSEVLLPPDLQLSNLLGKAIIGRTPQGLISEVAVSAQTAAECSRCLIPLTQGIATEFTELFAFDERNTTDSQLLLPKNHQIDFAPIIREYLILDMPLTSLCKSDCLGLCPECGVNRNDEDCGHVQESFDPRFDVLKDFFNKQD